MIQVICPQCGLRILVPATVQGRNGICFNCRAVLHVPNATKVSRHKDLAYEQGDRISDRYIIDHRIGKGGMGVVYRAHDTLVDETVALKFLHPNMLRTEEGQQLFIREAQIARRLRHENIVAVHDVSWTQDGILYLSMELAEGQSLRTFLRKHRQERLLISPRVTVALVKQILSALAFAHRTVVHRDIKPENVMLMPGEHVKVLDFGLAKAIHEELLKKGVAAWEKSHEDKERVIGTLAYAAPEQKRLQPVDLRADIYAVGLLMHELLSLRTPLDPPVSIPKVRKDVAPSILSVLDKALTEDKAQRWQSAGEFRKALEQAYEQSYRPISITTANRSAAGAEEIDDAGGVIPSMGGMIFIEGGSFLMGNDEVREQAPEEEVFVGPFWMDVYPVTVEQYAKYLEATGAPEPRFWHDTNCNGANQPVTGVSWEEALAYARWAGKSLPTEAQWEFAARGQANRKYPWGDLPPDTTRANFRDYLGMPSIVTMHDDGHSPDGFYDLAGNVHEWTADPFAPYDALRRNPEGARHIPRKAVRGGAWDSPAEELVASFRKGLFPEVREKNVGFRCVIVHARLQAATPDGDEAE